LHSKPEDTNTKLEAALELGCNRFDTALRGFGGCPMAKDDLTGNIATENLIALLSKKNIPHQLNMDAWNEALSYSWKVFNS
jgi:hydroxymethylglutaryl-CoA lyase